MKKKDKSMKKKSVIEAIHEAQNWFFEKEIDKPRVTSVIGKRVKVWVKGTNSKYQE